MLDGHPTSTALPFRCPGRQREPRAALCDSEQGAAFTNPCKADWGPQSPGDSMADLGEEGDSTCTPRTAADHKVSAVHAWGVTFG